MLTKVTGTKKVMVTGATGLVGSHLIKTLVAEHFQVKALYHTKALSELTDVEWIGGDILDVTFLEAAMIDVDIVIHCAANVSFNPKQRPNLYKVNIEGTANVVNACLSNNVKKLVHISSVAALDRNNANELITEELTYDEDAERSVYGQTKYLGEREVWRGIAEGLDAVIINPSIILGEGDWNDGSTELFKSVYNEFPWYTTGINGFVDVQDVVRIIMLLVESEITAERFIVCAENTSYQHLFNLIAKEFNKKQPHKIVTPFMAAVVWRLEAVKTLFSGTAPMITKETAETALSTYNFDNKKLKEYIPLFEYTPLAETVKRICAALKLRYQLS